jgi:hypothetical protein
MSSPLRELDHRSHDGIDVRLLWDPSADSVFVAVSDAKTGEAFTVPVPAGRRAYDVFHHPYAYAAATCEPRDLMAAGS